MGPSRSRITVDQLRSMLQATDPSALLVEPRILRRIIRLDRRLAGLGLFVPHGRCYTIERDRMLAYVDRDELDLSETDELPRMVILLIKPVDEESLDAVSTDEAVERYWRLLFHGRVHVELEKRIADFRPNNDFAQQRRRQIGEVEFQEIRAVLLKDELLFSDPADLEVYVEFVATYLELRYFAPQELPLHFPAVRDWRDVDRIVSQDLYHANLHELTKLPAVQPLVTEPPPTEEQAEPAAEGTLEAGAARRSRCLKLQARAERASGVGNGVKAAILRMRAAALAEPKQAEGVEAAAVAEASRLAQRLQAALRLSATEATAWDAALRPLLTPAARGYWANEARLLYDLQKVCVEAERGVFRWDIIAWCRSWGREPLRRPLPILRQILVSKHLRTARQRLASARLTLLARERLASLLDAAVDQAEQEIRDRTRPLIHQALDSVGLLPHNIPERVARRKLVEELLDRIVEHGFATMGDLRDALSKNDLKLQDVVSTWELVRGDQLLRADRQLAEALEGGYRPGAIYLRWSQRLSSLAFGTTSGRFFTQHVALPFGGAYLALAGIRHAVVALAGGHSSAELPRVSSFTSSGGSFWQFPLLVLLFGSLFSLLMHRPEFRQWCLGLTRQAWQIGRQIVVEYPARLLRSPLVQRLLHSQTYAAICAYALRPAVFTLLLALPALLTRRPWNIHVATNVFLLVALFLNSSAGSYAYEWFMDVLMRAWHELRIRVFAAVFHWIMDTFHRLLAGMDRVLYTVDEWLRFRAGDHRLLLLGKFLTGTCWFFISYLIAFVFTLLVEPQVNPIKHFPVVTVAHKLILPTGPMFVRELTPYLGSARANTLVWSTIWLIPGVFGFLVWELKGNWRLYAANRPHDLSPVPLGAHGETMLGLLRPGFHSGTLPKVFARLRRALRQAHRTGNLKPLTRQHLALQQAEVAVRRFVERELCGLLNEDGCSPSGHWTIQAIHAATSRVEVDLQCDRVPGRPLSLSWQEEAGRLVARTSHRGGLEILDRSDQNSLTTALAGLFQRTGVDEVRGPLPIPLSPLFAWQIWVQYWQDLAARDETAHSPRKHRPS